MPSLCFFFFTFQYNLYMSDTLVSETMATSSGSEMEHQMSSASMNMFKPMNDIQSRLGKVLYRTSNNTEPKLVRTIKVLVLPIPANLISVRSWLFSSKSRLVFLYLSSPFDDEVRLYIIMQLRSLLTLCQCCLCYETLQLVESDMP